MVIAPKEGEKRTVVSSGQALFDAEGQKVGAVVVMHDITERKRVEGELHKSASIVESSDDAIISKDLTGTILSWNTGAERIFGYAAEEVINHHISILIPLDRADEEPQIFEKIKRGERIDHYETVRVRKDGKRVLISLTVSSVRDADGKIVGISEIARDITERKRVEEELRRVKEQYELAVEGSNDGLWDWNIETNEVYFSPRRKSMLGFEDHEFENSFEAWEKSLHPDDRERALATVQAYFDGLTPQYELEHRLRHKDGAYRWILARAAVVRDENGKPYRMAGSHTDITERKQMEETLRESEMRLQALVGSIDEIVFEFDAEGTYINVWTSDESLLVRPKSELIGRRSEEVLGKEFSRPFVDAYQRILTSGQAESLEYSVELTKGRRWFLARVTPIPAVNGSYKTVCVLARDITERKRMEEDLKQARDAALESARLKSEFLANMSHEIRTPMNGVIGMTGLLLDTELDTEQREFTETIRSSADALLTVINDILDFSKIEARKLRFETLDFDLRNVVEGTVELLAERAHGKGVELIALVESHVPTTLRGDAGRLRQVLTNLVGNAVKFTERGEVVVRITKERESETDVVVRCTITDTGIGISQEAQRRLFEAFVQADGSTTRKYGGTGLGLVISKQLVEMMGGEIGLESEPGKGSTLWFTARLEKQPVAAETTPPSRVDLRGLKVLIAETNSTSRQMLVQQTASWEMRSDSAPNAAAALALLRAAAAQGEPYDVVLMNSHLPDMDGFQLARTIKDDPRIAAVRLILTTLIGRRGDGQQAREAGIAAYLIKPVKQSQLLDCLKEVIGEPSSVVTSSSALPRLVTRHTLEESKSSVRILLAEDNAVNQKVALYQLKELGYLADIVTNGREALAALARAPYDIVLMDCQMPEMDGFEATAEIRRRETGPGKRTAIIAMTANAMQGDREKCLAAGMDDYIAKPVQPAILRDALARWGLHPTATPDTASIAPPASAGMLEEIIDPAVIVSLREIQQEGEPDIVAELIGLYLRDTKSRLAALHKALADGNAQALEREAHTLKGSSANLGVWQIAALCAELEEALRQAGFEKVEPLLHQLEDQFARIAQVLEGEEQIV